MPQCQALLPCYAFSTQRWVSAMEVVVITREVSIISPQVTQASRGKVPGEPALGGS